MKSICIIPARSGSKRIHKKNIKNFFEKPIISYSIETALKSGIFDKVIVSTDDEEIAKISKKYGADIPFIRSKKNSSDEASTVSVIIEAFNKINYKKLDYIYACCLYPAAPFVSTDLLKKSFKKLQKGSFHSVFPIVEYGHPIQRSLILNEKKVQRYFNFSNKNTQDYRKTYHDAGQFYFFDIIKVLNTQKLISDNSSGIIVDRFKFQDIDSIEDWKLAELKYQQFNLKNKLK